VAEGAAGEHLVLRLGDSAVEPLAQHRGARKKPPEV
jgi:hypothetical protein